MSNFEQYLQSIGYKPFKKIHSKKKGWEFIPAEERYLGFFTTMEPGGLWNIWIKDGIEFWWGLNEASKPPTLYHPGIIDYNRMIDGKSPDDRMNILLKEKTPKEIYDLCMLNYLL
ncbi:MAG: hypothetical protein H7325_04755 [Pedobacter sp.]|nr:hypothetical protein [Pedobacter sp.]